MEGHVASTPRRAWKLALLAFLNRRRDWSKKPFGARWSELVDKGDLREGHLVFTKPLLFLALSIDQKIPNIIRRTIRKKLSKRRGGK